MKRLALVVVLALTGCATVKEEIRCTFEDCSKQEWDACIVVARQQPTPELVSLESLRCDTQKANRDAKRASESAQMDSMLQQYSQPPL